MYDQNRWAVGEPQIARQSIQSVSERLKETVPVPDSKPEIDREFERLDDAVKMLHTEINALQERLRVISLPRPEKEESKAGCSCGSELGQAISRTADSVQDSIYRLADLRNSLAI